MPVLSFAISKNVFIEYTKITFYVCPYDNLVYIIYLQGKKVKQPYISNSEFPPHKRVKRKQSVNKFLYPVYKSPKNVVYSEGNFLGSMAAPIILIAVPQKTAMPVFPF